MFAIWNKTDTYIEKEDYAQKKLKFFHVSQTLRSERSGP
jgi:hypothetical protein